MNGWLKWDENNPPPPGEYVIWDPCLRDGREKVWEFRKGEFGDKKRWGYKRGTCVWFNAGGWQADRAPAYYCPFPRFPREMLTGKEGAQ